MVLDEKSAGVLIPGTKLKEDMMEGTKTVRIIRSLIHNREILKAGTVVTLPAGSAISYVGMNKAEYIAEPDKVQAEEKAKETTKESTAGPEQEKPAAPSKKGGK